MNTYIETSKGVKIRITETSEQERDSLNYVASFAVDAFAVGVGWYSVHSESITESNVEDLSGWRNEQMDIALWILEAPT